MQFDDFDKRIRDAAEHHHPAYEEKAWEKMETLLDKHLPTKKDDRRRIIFFLLLFLLTGIGAYLWIGKPGRLKTSVTKGHNKETGKTASPLLAADTAFIKPAQNNMVAEKNAVSTNRSNIKSNDVTGNKNDDVNGSAINKIQQFKSSTTRIKENSLALKTFARITKQTKKNKNVATNNNAIVLNKSVSKKDFDKFSPGIIHADGNQKEETIKSASAPINDNKAIDKKDDIIAISNAPDSLTQKKSDNQDIQQEEKNIPVPEKKDIKKKGKQKQSPFAVTFTTGPDLSFVGTNKPGKVKLSYGAGLSYTFNRIILRSGFYVSKKIYTAGASDYHPYYANLQKVDGDCKVYAIPVTVSYNFVQAKNHNWFASAGLSSYLMKRETYGYLSKDPVTGMTNYKSWTLKNKNKHYFSVLNLSAGYERKFTKNISLITEPYLQIPMAGVGNGKIKLNSAGVLFTLSIKPFVGRK